MGKVVILGGNARSGKSTLAYNLVKCGFSRISLDNLNDIISTSFNVDFDNLNNNEKIKYFQNIINKSLEEAKNNNMNTVIDMYDYLPEDIELIKNKEELEIYFLAYPNCTIQEIKYNVIHYAKPTDWIAQVNEKYLSECVVRFYERNIIIKEQCLKYNYKMIDTSSGKERDIVLDNLKKIILHE